LSPGFSIDSFGLFALADNAADSALANYHDELIDSSILGQREYVHGFDLFIVGIMELLDDLHRGYIAADLCRNVGVFEW